MAIPVNNKNDGLDYALAFRALAADSAENLRKSSRISSATSVSVTSLRRSILPDKSLPRHPDELETDERNFIDALAAELGDEVGAIMSGYLRKVIHKPTGLTKDQETRVKETAKKKRFPLSDW